MKQVYLDNAATTPMSPTVIDVITDEMANDFGNASSTHTLGVFVASPPMNTESPRVAYGYVSEASTPPAFTYSCVIRPRSK